MRTWWIGTLLVAAVACGGDGSEGVSRSCDQAWRDQPPIEGVEGIDFERLAEACGSAADYVAGARAYPESVADGADPLTLLNNTCFDADDPATRNSAACRESLAATP